MMVSHGGMEGSMSAGTDPHRSLFLQFRDDRLSHEDTPSSGLCFVDSDDEFSIDDFQCRIESIEAELSQEEGPTTTDGGGGHSLGLGAPTAATTTARGEEKHFWDREKEALSSDTANDLLETLENTATEAGDLATGFICEESDDEATRKLVGQDPSLGSLVFLYGLKSDVVLSREKDRSESRTGSHRKGHSLDIDVDQFEMTERGVAEMTSDFYDHPPHLGSDTTSGSGDDTMALFYEFQNLLFVDPTNAAEDVDSGAHHQTTPKTKFNCADELKDGGGFEGDLKSLMRRRKRAASIELSSYDESLSDRLLTESPAYSSSSQTTTGLPQQSPSQSDYQQPLPVKQITGSLASSTSLSDVSWMRGEMNYPPEKRSRFSEDGRGSFPTQTDSRTGDKWNGIPPVNTSDSIAHLHAFQDAAPANRTGEHGTGSGWHRTSNPPTFPFGPSGCFEMWGSEDKRRGDGTRQQQQHPASALDSLPSGPASETVWTMPGSLYSYSQFNEAELVHSDEFSSLQSACKGLNDASRSIPLDTILASFLNSCPEMAGNVGERNQHKNDFMEARDQVSVTEIRNLPKASFGSTDARRTLSGETASGLQGHVLASPVPYPVGMTDRAKGTTTDWNVYEMHRSRLIADRDAQVELSGGHPAGQSSTSGWSLPTNANTRATLPVSLVSLPPAIHGLPFPFPPVPSGYKLVITHQSLPPAGKESTQPQKETRIIIIHPAQEASPDQNLPSITTYHQSPPSTPRTVPSFPHPQHDIIQQNQQQQLGHRSLGGCLRRPADFDLPQKTSVQYFSHRSDHGSKSSSPMTPALDLSFNSILTQASNPDQTRYQTPVYNPVHQTSPSFTNALWQNGTSGIQPTMTTSHTMTTLHTMTTPHTMISHHTMTTPHVMTTPHTMTTPHAMTTPHTMTTSHAMTTSASHRLTNSSSLSQTVCPSPSGDGLVCPATSGHLFTQRPSAGQCGHHPGLLSSVARSSPVDPADLSTEVHLADVMFPPNVVIGPSCCPGQRLSRHGNAGVEDLSPVAHARRPSSETGSGGGVSGGGRASSPASAVEPDSTVQPTGQRDIIRALTDKIRRNKTQRRISDNLNLVSTTSQSPNASLTDGQSPHPEPIMTTPNQQPHSDPPAFSDSTETPPDMHHHQPHHQQHSGTDAILSRSADVSAALKPSQIGIKSEMAPSPSSVDRPSSVLASPSAGSRSPRGESGVHGNRDSTASTESNEQKVNGMGLEWLTSSNGEYSSDREKSFDGKSFTAPAESDRCDFSFFLDAPISTAQRQTEDRITYLNKGQYYRLSLECMALPYQSENVVFKSVVMVLFRDSRTVGDELEAWKIWHSRQQSYKQRILDIDYKDACGVGLNSMKELAYNATALTWSAADQPVKVNVAVNCLSTDFSNQKGVKGIPLHIQIDTYDVSTPELPIHRAYCKIKVFCDKGAERKVRDEERKREKRNKTKPETTLISETHESCCTSLRQSNFQPVEDLTKEPIFFIPSNDIVHSKPAATEKKTAPVPTSSYGSSRNATTELNVDDNQTTTTKQRSRPTSIIVSREYQRVLLYVREMQEEVFTALLLQTPTVPALAQAIHEKCNIEANKIKNIYKKSKKGILVKMDDKILRHYSNESTFIITTVTNSAQSNNESVMYDVILAEIDVDTH